MSDKKKKWPSQLFFYFFLRHAGFTLLDLSVFPLKLAIFTENLSFFPVLFFFPPTPAGQEILFLFFFPPTWKKIPRRDPSSVEYNESCLIKSYDIWLKSGLSKTLRGNPPPPTLELSNLLQIRLTECNFFFFQEIDSGNLFDHTVSNSASNTSQNQQHFYPSLVDATIQPTEHTDIHHENPEHSEIYPAFQQYSVFSENQNVPDRDQWSDCMYAKYNTQHSFYDALSEAEMNEFPLTTFVWKWLKCKEPYLFNTKPRSS